MLDRSTAAQAAEAMHRAARFGIGQVTETTLASIERVLEGFNTDAPSCPDRLHPGNRISCLDEHAADRDREDRAGGGRDV